MRMSRVGSDWIEQYVSALTVRDTHEHAHKHYIDSYTKLADRSAAVAPTAKSEILQPTTPTNLSTRIKPGVPPADLHHDTTAIEKLRADLSATQKARTALTSQVGNLTASIATQQAQIRDQASEISTLARRKADLERRLHDRDEELRGKQRLVQEAQDEMIALELQLNMAEQTQERLQKENKELVDRWMKRVGEEADRVNRDSRWT